MSAWFTRGRGGRTLGGCRVATARTMPGARPVTPLEATTRTVPGAEPMYASAGDRTSGDPVAARLAIDRRPPSSQEIPMSIFRRLLGGTTEPARDADPTPYAAGGDAGDQSLAGGPASTAGPSRSSGGAAPDTATVRRLVSQLEALPPERARYLAAASYVLARVSNADLVMSPEETLFMERTLVEESGIGEAEAVLVVEAAKQQARLFGSTEDYLVTREFKRISNAEQRLRLLRACFLAAAADTSISSAESATLDQIASELDIDAPALSALRGEFGDRLSVVQALRAVRRGPVAGTDPTQS